MDGLVPSGLVRVSIKTVDEEVMGERMDGWMGVQINLNHACMQASKQGRLSAAQRLLIASNVRQRRINNKYKILFFIVVTKLYYLMT